MDNNLAKDNMKVKKNEENIETKWLTKIVGRGICRQRDLIKMTQKKLAEKLSITVKAMSCLENGKTSITFQRLEEICEIFSCPIDAFLQDYESTNIPMRLKTLASTLALLEPAKRLKIAKHAKTVSDSYRTEMSN